MHFKHFYTIFFYIIFPRSFQWLSSQPNFNNHRCKYNFTPWINNIFNINNCDFILEQEISFFNETKSDEMRPKMKFSCLKKFDLWLLCISYRLNEIFQHFCSLSLNESELNEPKSPVSSIFAWSERFRSLTRKNEMKFCWNWKFWTEKNFVQYRELLLNSKTLFVFKYAPFYQ